MEPAEIVEVTKQRIGCDGGGGALGHPLVYYTVPTEGHVDCGYCGRRFILKQGARAEADH